MTKIFLASSSPRRKQLLTILGLPFSIVETNFVEDMALPLSPRQLVKTLALGKAQSVSKKHRGIIIAADTFVVFRGKVMGKPHTAKIARRILSQISGKTLLILTGLAIIDTVANKVVVRAVETKVWFKKLTPVEITAYIKTGEPLDRAGAFAIQDRGAMFIKKISGDFYGAMGLPLCALAEELKKLKVKI